MARFGLVAVAVAEDGELEEVGEGVRDEGEEDSDDEDEDGEDDDSDLCE